MTNEKQRQINPRSLENLKLGAEARYQGKVRRNTTLLPETIEWLERRGKVSEMIDQLVAEKRSASLNGDMADQLASRQNSQSSHTHNSISSEAPSNNTHKSTMDIAEVHRQALEIQALKHERDQLRHQLEDMAAHAAEWYEKASEKEKCNQQLQNQERHHTELPDLEAVRDRILQSLRLGRQAPEYKRTKAILERFIQELQQ